MSVVGEALTAIERDLAAVKTELSVLGSLFDPRAVGNPMTQREYIASMILFVTWSAIAIGVAFGVAETPPFWHVFTGAVLLVFGRMWGIKLAHHAVGLSNHPQEGESNRED